MWISPSVRRSDISLCRLRQNSLAYENPVKNGDAKKRTQNRCVRGCVLIKETSPTLFIGAWGNITPLFIENLPRQVSSAELSNGRNGSRPKCNR